jgi:hypothetical protein
VSEEVEDEGRFKRFRGLAQRAKDGAKIDGVVGGVESKAKAANRSGSFSASRSRTMACSSAPPVNVPQFSTSCECFSITPIQASSLSFAATLELTGADRLPPMNPTGSDG